MIKTEVEVSRSAVGPLEYMVPARTRVLAGREVVEDQWLLRFGDEVAIGSGTAKNGVVAASVSCGSPSWTRFELLQRKTWFVRTARIAVLSVAFWLNLYNHPAECPVAALFELCCS
jgi:hypothetical protein